MRNGVLRRQFGDAHLWLCAGALLCAAAMPAQAQFVRTASEKSATKPGFTMPANQRVRVILFRPDVSVGEQTAGGMSRPHADWTVQARTALGASLGKLLDARNSDVKVMPELSGSDASLMADYRALFKVVAKAVISNKLFPNDPLPSKKERFDWSLGPGAAELGKVGEGDYGLFIYTFDTYGSTGRKAMETVGSALGVDLGSDAHIGYAGLIDLSSGDLVWINVDVRMHGDVRTEAGADERIAQLLSGFPQRALAEAAEGK